MPKSGEGNCSQLFRPWSGINEVRTADSYGTVFVLLCYLKFLLYWLFILSVFVIYCHCEYLYTKKKNVCTEEDFINVQLVSYPFVLFCMTILNKVCLKYTHMEHMSSCRSGFLAVFLRLNLQFSGYSYFFVRHYIFVFLSCHTCIFISYIVIKVEM